jgi:hypothetical protein
MLGLNVFSRYLRDVGIENLETTYSKEKYIAAVQRRKMIYPHAFDKPMDELKLENKFILGIDIGGSGIKLKFYKILKQDVIQKEGRKRYYILSEQPADTKQRAAYKIDKGCLANLVSFGAPTTAIRKLEGLSANDEDGFRKKFTQTINNVLSNIDEKEDKIFRKEGEIFRKELESLKNLKAKEYTYKHTHYYLEPFYLPLKKGNYKNKDEKTIPLEFSMPTLPPEKDERTGDDAKFQDAKEFADYIVETLWSKLEAFGTGSQKMQSKQGEEESGMEEDVRLDIFRNIISVGFCWPGPIKQNRITSTSRILSYFKGFSNKILDNEYSDIVELDIATAVRRSFEDKISDSSTPLTIALENDGDVEAAGLAFGRLNLHETPNQRRKIAPGFRQNANKMDFYRELFEEHSVVIIKAGTGTAGSVLEKGEIKGLNEFGKLIVDLGTNNSENEKKEKNDRWPCGDANKFFSMEAFREIMVNLGVPESVKDEITGRDIDLIINTQDVKALRSENVTKKFGVMELINLAQPHIDWNDLYITRAGRFRKNITIKYGADRAYRIINEESSDQNNEIDEYTWYHLVKEPLIRALHLSADDSIPLNRKWKKVLTKAGDNRIVDFFTKLGNSRIADFLIKLGSNRNADFLTKLGNNRIARLNLEEVVKKKKENSSFIGQEVQEIGRKLGDVLALLFDIYRPKGVIVAGGIMSSDTISKDCMNGLEEALKNYLFDTYHDESRIIKRLDKDSEKLGELSDCKLVADRTGENHALLGAAILGFDHYIIPKRLLNMKTWMI